MTETKKPVKKPMKKPVKLEIKGDPTVQGIVEAVNVLKKKGKEVDQASLAQALDKAVEV